MKLTAIRNHILFEFLDKLDKNGQFTQTTSFGLHLMGDHSDSANSSRWAKVLATGPDVATELTRPNCEVLIENLRWTEGVVFEGKTYWKTDDKQILAYRYPAE